MIQFDPVLKVNSSIDIGVQIMAKREYKNQLNNLSTKDWLKFQKSWFIHNPPARKKGVLRHPAKYPETLAQEFIEFFTKEGEFVLDPDGRNREHTHSSNECRPPQLWDRT